jgi:hypothetical protein
LPAEELDPARVWGYQAEQEPQQRRLACAIRADEATNTARLDPKIDCLEGDHRAEALRQPERFDGCRVSRTGGHRGSTWNAPGRSTPQR